jgi:hypothetical protein
MSTVIEEDGSLELQTFIGSFEQKCTSIYNSLTIEVANLWRFLIGANKSEGNPMFVVSVLDQGDERNFVVIEVRLEDNFVFFEAGSRKLRYRIADLLDVVPVEVESQRTSRWTLQRSSVVN